MPEGGGCTYPMPVCWMVGYGGGLHRDRERRGPERTDLRARRRALGGDRWCMALAGDIRMASLAPHRDSGNSGVHALRVGLSVRCPGLCREHRAADRTGLLIAQGGRAEQRDDDGEQDGQRSRTPAAHAGHGDHPLPLSCRWQPVGDGALRVRPGRRGSHSE